MEPPDVLLMGVILGVLGLVGYGLHRVGLWLEARGWIFYRKHQSSSTAAGSMLALQQIVEPSVRHVIEMKEEHPSPEEQAPPG